MSTVDNSTHDSVMQPKDVQQINELPDISPAKLHSTVDKTSGYHIKQQINNTELLDNAPAKPMSTVVDSTHNSIMQPKDVIPF